MKHFSARFRLARSAATALVLIAAASAAGCTTSRQVRGYVVDEEVMGAIAPGVDNRISVAETLGTPSATSAYGPETWYYISRHTQQKAFFEEYPTNQTVLEIRFDDAGTVAEVGRYDLADAREIDPRGEKTPVRSKTTGFFEQLFSNIGRVGAGRGPGGPGGPGGGR